MRKSAASTLLAMSLLVLLLCNLFLSSLDAAPVHAADLAGAPATGFTVNADQFGLNVQVGARYGNFGQFQTPINKAKETGAGWNREELRWDTMERGALGALDEAVNKSQAAGFNVLGLLGYNITGSGRAAQKSVVMPDLTAWKSYVSGMVTRYKGKIRYWEIWNEPDDPRYFQPVAGRTYNSKADPEFIDQSTRNYAQLLITAYDTIKSIDPSSQIVTGGIDGFNVQWLEKMLSAGGDGHYDVLGAHPYVNFSASPEAKSWAETQLAIFKAFAARRANNAPVWATEFGWTTKGGNDIRVSEDQQANYIARSFVSGLASGLDKMFIYQYHEEQNDPDDAYGIVKSDWVTPKPAFVVTKNLISQLSGARFVDKIDVYDYTRTAIEGFENSNGVLLPPFATPGTTANGAVVSERAHTGSRSLKLDYNFQSDGINYFQVDKNAALTGQPTKVGFWVYGDNQGSLANLILRDGNGNILSYPTGRISTQSWQRREAYLPGERYVNGNLTRGAVAYPITLIGIQVTSEQPGLKWAGSIYLDDWYAEEGGNVQAYRFEKNGKNIDAIWSDGGDAAFRLPTKTDNAKVTQRDGSSGPLKADNGALAINATNNMIFVEHEGVLGGGTSSVCGKPSSTIKPDTGFPNVFFKNFYDRYDFYATGNRSFVWGEKPFASGNEPYAQALDGNAQNVQNRQVLYFDKSRMEITRVSDNPANLGYVTNGLLTNELISGKIQLGDNQDDPAQYAQCAPAQVPVAGDPDDTGGPRYASLAKRLGDAPKAVGAPVTETINANGDVANNPATAGFNVRGGYYESITKHTIAAPFWNFLNDPNQRILVNGQPVTGKLFDPYYVAPGLPITEAYWAKVKVGGVEKDVLIQAFERRVLTYTPSNVAAFQVEWGNIGRHYFFWRYGQQY